MNPFIQTLLIYISLYGALIFLILFIINVLFKGYFIPWIRVKTSRGKNVLVHIRTPLNKYYKVGKIETGFLIFKGNDKEERRLVISNQSIIEGEGVKNVFVDDELSSVLIPNFESVSGFDPAKWNNYLIRALTKPTIGINKQEVIIIFLLIGAVCGIVALVYLSYNQGNEILLIKDLISRGSIENVATQTLGGG